MLLHMGQTLKHMSLMGPYLFKPPQVHIDFYVLAQTYVHIHIYCRLFQNSWKMEPA